MGRRFRSRRAAIGRFESGRTNERPAVPQAVNTAAVETVVEGAAGRIVGEFVELRKYAA